MAEILYQLRIRLRFRRNLSPRHNPFFRAVEMKTLFDIAKARTDHPIQSYIAADKMNRAGKVRMQQMAVLKALVLHGASTARHLDEVMPISKPEWRGFAHRRMPELEEAGLVVRDKRGQEMLCSITEKGKELLEWHKTKQSQ